MCTITDFSSRADMRVERNDVPAQGPLVRALAAQDRAAVYV